MKRMAFLMALAMTLMMSSMALAQLQPYPVAIKVRLADATTIQVFVRITDTRSLDKIEAYTNQYGEYIDDLGNYKWPQKGDTLRIEVLGTSRDVVWNGQPIFEQFDFLQIKSTCPACTYEPVKCQAIKDLTFGETLSISDAECEVLVTAPEKPAAADITLELAITVIISLVVGAGGYAAVKKRTGVAIVRFKRIDGKLYHSHANYAKYHDPNTVHTYQPHKQGELTPAYSTKKNADGKYDYVGG